MLLRSSNPNTSDDKRCREPSYEGKSSNFLGVERPLKGANAEEYLDINRFLSAAYAVRGKESVVCRACAVSAFAGVVMSSCEPVPPTGRSHRSGNGHDARNRGVQTSGRPTDFRILFRKSRHSV